MGNKILKVKIIFENYLKKLNLSIQPYEDIFISNGFLGGFSLLFKDNKFNFYGSERGNKYEILVTDDEDKLLYTLFDYLVLGYVITEEKIGTLKYFKEKDYFMSKLNKNWQSRLREECLQGNLYYYNKKSIKKYILSKLGSKNLEKDYLKLTKKLALKSEKEGDFDKAIYYYNELGEKNKVNTIYRTWAKKEENLGNYERAFYFYGIIKDKQREFKLKKKIAIKLEKEGFYPMALNNYYSIKDFKKVNEIVSILIKSDNILDLELVLSNYKNFLDKKTIIEVTKKFIILAEKKRDFLRVLNASKELGDYEKIDNISNYFLSESISINDLELIIPFYESIRDNKTIFKIKEKMAIILEKNGEFDKAKIYYEDLGNYEKVDEMIDKINA